MGQKIDAKFGGYVAIPFGVANLDSSLTNGTMTIGGTAAQNVEIVVPFAGSLVGIGVKGNAAATAGTAAFTAVVDGTRYSSLAATVTTAAANTQKATATRDVGEIKFSAGATVAVQAVTSTTFAPTTVEYDAILYIQLDND